MTKLGSAIAQGSATSSPVATRFLAALQGRRPGKPIRIPVLELDAYMALVGSERMLDLEGESLRAMDRRGIPRDPMNEAKYELDLALRMLAEAVTESEDSATPIGTVAEWGKLAPEAIAAMWLEYSALREEHDPVDVSLTPDDINEIRDAIVKKNAMLLRYFGPRRLASYLITSESQPASSPEPSSSPGDSSPTS